MNFITGIIDKVRSVLCWSWRCCWILWFVLCACLLYFLRGPLGINFNFAYANMFLNTLTPKFYVALTGTSSLISGLILRVITIRYLDKIFEWWYFKKYGTSFIEQISLNHISPYLNNGEEENESDSQEVSTPPNCIQDCKLWRNPYSLFRGSEYNRLTKETNKEALTYYDMNLTAQDHQTLFTCESDQGKPEYELMQLAWRERNPAERIKKAKDALNQNPDCTTAMILLAEEECTEIVDVEKAYKQAYKIAETAIRKSQYTNCYSPSTNNITTINNNILSLPSNHYQHSNGGNSLTLATNNNNHTTSSNTNGNQPICNSNSNSCQGSGIFGMSNFSFSNHNTTTTNTNSNTINNSSNTSCQIDSIYRRDINVYIFIRRRLAMCARKLGKLKEAIKLFKDLMKEYSNGNLFSIQENLIECYLEAQQYADVSALLSKYDDIHHPKSATICYTTALLKARQVADRFSPDTAFKRGLNQIEMSAVEAIHRAVEFNPHVPKYLLEINPLILPTEHILKRGDSEAISYAFFHLQHWKNVDGALNLLHCTWEGTFRLIPSPLEKGNLFYPYPSTTESADRELLPAFHLISVYPKKDIPFFIMFTAILCSMTAIIAFLTHSYPEQMSLISKQLIGWVGSPFQMFMDKFETLLPHVTISNRKL